MLYFGKCLVYFSVKWYLFFFFFFCTKYVFIWQIKVFCCHYLLNHFHQLQNISTTRPPLKIHLHQHWLLKHHNYLVQQLVIKWPSSPVTTSNCFQEKKRNSPNWFFAAELFKQCFCYFVHPLHLCIESLTAVSFRQLWCWLIVLSDIPEHK